MPKKFYVIIWVLCLCSALVCAGGIFYFRSLYAQADAVYSTVSFRHEPSDAAPEPSASPPQEQFDWQQQKARFPDLVAWLEGAGLDYPVVQGQDNTFYLDHLANGEENAVGSIFLDCNNASDFSDEVSVIYGHNVKEQRMFGGLQQYCEQEFYQQNPQILLHTPQQDFVIELFAAVLVDAYTQSYPLSFESPQQREEFLNDAAERSFFQADFFPSEQDHLVILSTCSSRSSDMRLALIGVRKEINL